MTDCFGKYAFIYLFIQIPIFFQPSNQMKIDGKKLMQCSTEWREMAFSSCYQEFRQIEGSRNCDSTIFVYLFAYLFFQHQKKIQVPSGTGIIFPA